MDKQLDEMETYQKFKSLIEEDKEFWSIKPNFKYESNHFLKLNNESIANSKEANFK